jgi:hypothetical protein
MRMIAEGKIGWAFWPPGTRKEEMETDAERPGEREWRGVWVGGVVIRERGEVGGLDGGDGGTEDDEAGDGEVEDEDEDEGDREEEQEEETEDDGNEEDSGGEDVPPALPGRFAALQLEGDEEDQDE